MITHPYWITSQLAIIPRPRGGDWLDDEMLALKDAGIQVVVSMLEKEEAVQLTLQREELAAESLGLRFINFGISDRGVPENAERFIAFLADVEHHLKNDNRVGVHCRACIGRASVTTASLLIRSGMLVADAWQQVSTARGCSVPDTVEQLEWVERHISSRQQ